MEYVRLLAKNEQFKSFVNSTAVAGLEIVADFTPEHVFNAPEYQELMLSFNSKIHLYLSRNQRSSYLKSARELQTSLHRVDHKIHPQLKYDIWYNLSINRQHYLTTHLICAFLDLERLSCMKPITQRIEKEPQFTLVKRVLLQPIVKASLKRIRNCRALIDWKHSRKSSFSVLLQLDKQQIVMWLQSWFMPRKYTWF